MLGPAYLIATPRLHLRCWNPADAPLLAEAIAASIEHLRPWMPWIASEPEALAVRVNRMRQWRANFDRDHDYVYGIFDPSQPRVLGGTGLHTRVGGSALEIGYWLRPEATGQGLARELAAALTRVAFQVHQVERVEIHCDPANQRSAAVAKALGYQHEATLARRLNRPDGSWRDVMIWTLFADAYPGSAAAALAQPIAAFDVIGQSIHLAAREG